MAPITADSSGVKVPPRLNSSPIQMQRQGNVVRQQLRIQIDEGGRDRAQPNSERAGSAPAENPKCHADVARDQAGEGLDAG